MNELATVPLKRCPGWHFEGYRGQVAHTLPATREYFHACTSKPDGLNHKCKSCNNDYRVYRTKIWNAERAKRKARNEALIEHAAGDVAGGSRKLSGPGNSSAASGEAR